MSFIGVGGLPYIDLDEFIDIEAFDNLFDELVIGISKSWVDKGVVSCGVRDTESRLELCTVLNSPHLYLSQKQMEILEKLDNLHQKAWYCSLILPIHHPYSLVFIRREKDFWKKQYFEFSDWTHNAVFFPKTIEFIKSLPFKEFGRILLFITEPNEETLIHYDGGRVESRKNANTEMIYFRPGPNKKKIFIWDDFYQKEYVVKSTASYWNDLDYHGVHASIGKSFSLRIDGVFTDEFRNQLSDFSNKNKN